MRLFHAPAIFAVAVVLGACAQSTIRDSEPLASTKPEPVQWDSAPQPIEPEAVQPVPQPRYDDLVVLLPKSNGTAGAVVVRSGGEELLIDKPYAAAQVREEGSVQALTYDAERARQDFGAVIAALPARAASFTLYFLEGKDELTSESEGEVTRIFAELAARPDPEIWVIGHTDAVGTPQYNDQLSLQRAERVRDDLVSRGIPADRIEVSGRGMREPLVPTSEGIAEAQNRRVEINVR